MSQASPSKGSGAEQQLAFDDKRHAAARNPDKTKGEGKARKEVVAGQGNCPQCRGTHGECTACPNTVAVKDGDYDEKKAIADKRPCYFHFDSSKQCTGMGHMSKHHLEVMTAANVKIHEDSKKKYLDGKKLSLIHI